MKSKIIFFVFVFAFLFILSLSCFAAQRKIYARTASGELPNNDTNSESTTELTTETIEETTEKSTEKPTGKSTANSTSSNNSKQTGTVKTRGSSSRASVVSKEIPSTTESSEETSTEAVSEPMTIKDPIDALVDSIPNYVPKTFSPEITTDVTEEGNLKKSSQIYSFESGDKFQLDRFEFKAPSSEPYTHTLYIEGDNISIRYVDPDTKTWVATMNVDNIKNNTLFISTTKENAVVSVPGVYKNVYTNNTLDIMRDLETPYKITRESGGYRLTTQFPIRTDCICEAWYLKSLKPVVDWSKQSSFDNLLNHDLGIERRWSWDGYYYKIPSNYVPTGENMLYRNPANYTGALCVKLNDSVFTRDMGYVMTYTCMNNQNKEGFWATGPKSLWLEEDFQIGENFFDTRFNTDFALSLIDAYRIYNNKAFLRNAIIYGNFLCRHADYNHYQTANGGWLVEDYGEIGEHKRTHVSLNHHLAELNFLYELYHITEKEDYKITADTMLLGVEDSQEQWVLPDGNLNYALMYNGTGNVMVDYPYLTYNDLLKTKQLLRKYFNVKNDTINYLMDVKMKYMISHNITGYNQDI